MTSDPLSGDYIRWLASQIRGDEDGNPNRTYGDLAAIMYEKEFVELVPNDYNRMADGLGLRVEFCHEANIRLEEVQDFLDKVSPVPRCSFLEVLIGLSRRLAFQASGSAPGWAWILMHNLELHRITDPVGRAKARRANDILDACIQRRYSFDGVGGFFPLRRAAEDQTLVEIWYQMSAYLAEGEG
jgi:hypothetical protein